MQNNSNYDDIYVNRVQLPPSQSEIFYNVQQTEEAARSTRQLPPSQSPIFQNIIETIVLTVPNGSIQIVGEPPTYVEAISTSNIDPIAGPPPSYDSLFGRVIEARRQSNGFLDLLKNIFVLILYTLQYTFVLCHNIVIPICMIVIGSVFFDQCPQGEYIPVYLVVSGIMRIIYLLRRPSTIASRNQEDQATPQTNLSVMDKLIHCFMFSWFVLGSYWIYRIYEPNYDKSRGMYCNKTLYLFSFWVVSYAYIVVGAVCVGIVSVIVAVFVVVLYKQKTRSDTHFEMRVSLV